jgi:arginine decarboxylase-like protein
MEMSNSTDGNEPWDIQAARNLYNIHRWGAEYFDINEAGHVVAKPLRDAGASVELTDVIEEAGARAEVSAADSIPGHSAPPGRVDQPGLPQFHR